MSIVFNFQKSKFAISQRTLVRRWITEVIVRGGGRVGAVSYFFCDDNYLIGRNRQFLQHDTFTDIITFDYVGGNLISGDILISVERVRENAANMNIPFDEELHRVIIHGILHLLGQGDKTPAEAAEMRAKEDMALSLLKELKADVSRGTNSSSRCC